MSTGASAVPSQIEERILEHLNEAQRDAVVHGEGPLLIIAGAGTGKTTVLTRRIAHIIATKRARPEEILALTFTEKAAAEMAELRGPAHPLGLRRDRHLDLPRVRFIPSEAYLVTVRYLNPKPFDAFAARIQKPGSNCSSSTDVMIGLLETIIDRMADILEMHSAEVERISNVIFSQGVRKSRKKINLHATITDIGHEGNHFSTLRESIVSVRPAWPSI